MFNRDPRGGGRDDLLFRVRDARTYQYLSEEVVERLRQGVTTGDEALTIIVQHRHGQRDLLRAGAVEVLARSNSPVQLQALADLLSLPAAFERFMAIGGMERTVELLEGIDRQSGAVLACSMAHDIDNAPRLLPLVPALRLAIPDDVESACNAIYNILHGYQGDFAAYAYLFVPMARVLNDAENLPETHADASGVVSYLMRAPVLRPLITTLVPALARLVDDEMTSVNALDALIAAGTEDVFTSGVTASCLRILASSAFDLECEYASAYLIGATRFLVNSEAVVRVSQAMQRACNVTTGGTLSAVIFAVCTANKAMREVFVANGAVESALGFLLQYEVNAPRTSNAVAHASTVLLVLASFAQQRIIDGGGVGVLRSLMARGVHSSAYDTVSILAIGPDSIPEVAELVPDVAAGVFAGHQGAMYAMYAITRGYTPEERPSGRPPGDLVAVSAVRLVAPSAVGDKTKRFRRDDVLALSSLARISPFFASAFAPDWKRTSTAFVLKGVDEDVVDAVVDFARTGRVDEWNRGLAFRVVRAAEFYALPDLAFQAEAFLFSETTRENAEEFLAELDEDHASTLRAVCLFWVLHQRAPRNEDERALARWWGL